ncbi:LCP family protein [Saccharopolyspora sp. NFXS83]|uniref:LCP family protein n=1 Tax=Saccharopolyspora sp. NFXS83 TaxID=2993560 RepID=UPI00224B7A5F|nr:LCP family protein [Saccharopolyspora sp. NFXS83]MCX2733879.1 LCP family protein [Saccharopolyspora sp. NFXS83]
MADEQVPRDADQAAEQAADRSADTSEPRGEPTTRRRRGRRLARITGRALFALLSAGVLAITAAGWTALDRLSGEVSSAEVLTETPDAPPADDGATDLLLVGNDSRTDAQGEPLPLDVLRELRTESTSGLNTDTLVLLRVPHDGAQPTAVSLPRDTSVAMPGGTQKINAVYGLAKAAAARRDSGSGADAERRAQLAGQRALVQSVQGLAGVRVDRYAEVNLLGFYEVTDALGGVEVCLNQATSDKDSGADFAAGRQTISGGDALAFVRQRHGLPRGDLDRIVRQQVFMAAVANKLLSTGTLTDPAKLAGLQDAARRSVVLDQSWDVTGFAAQMQGLASGSVRFVTLPVRSVGDRDEHGQSVVKVDPAQVHDFIAGLVPTAGVVGRPALDLDGTARHQGEAPAPSGPITSAGIPCVN